MKTVTDDEWNQDLQDYKQHELKEQKIMNELNQSNVIGALAAALCKVQGSMIGAVKDSSNPFFKSKYADLASVWESCRAQLAANNLCVIQTTEMGEHGAVLVTTLAHSSGEWIRGVFPIKTKDESPQVFLSALTYARRGSLAAIVGIAQIDDDGESAQGRKVVVTPELSMSLTTKVASCNTIDDLTALYKSISPSDRAAATSSFTARRAELQGE